MYLYRKNSCDTITINTQKEFSKKKGKAMEPIPKEELKKHLPLWLKEHGCSLNKNFRCFNPEHEDKHPSMHYFPQTETVHCFACGVTYDIFHLVGQEEHIPDFPSQLKRVQERYGFSQREPSSFLGEKKEADEQSVSLFVKQHRTNQPPELLEWFSTRGIPEQAVKAANIFLFEGRAVFPVSRHGTWVSWCGRALQDGVTPRYRNSAGKMGIWGVDALFSQTGQPIAVCEGILDAMSLQLCGCKAVALCGAGNTGRLIQELQNLPGSLPPLIFAGDDDEAGREMCRQLKAWMTEAGGVCTCLALPDGCKDVNEAWVRAPQQLQAALSAARQELALLPHEGKTDACPSMAALSEDFLSYLSRCQQMGVLSSGLAELDELLGGGLFPGLYVLGAPSSLGKTTLLLQMADEIAASGRDVLFFSLEMSRWELLAKSLCRTAAPQTALCARQLLRGEIPSSQLKRLLEAYNRRSGERIFISAEHEALTPEILKEKALRHREQHGRAPVVVVDYLQILAPSDARGSDKQNVDRAVVALKALSRELEIPVLVASSFNREAYTKEVSMEAFKESGAVEYAADVLLALQMSAAGEKDFDLNREKMADPRRVDIVLLKNRSGVPYGKVPLLYYSAENRFIAAKEPVSPARQSVRRIGRKQ